MDHIKKLALENEAVWTVATETFINFEGVAEISSQFVEYQVYFSKQVEINNGGWDIIKESQDDKVPLLMNLLLYWLINLRDPVVPDELLAMFSQPSLAFPEKILLLGAEPFELINFTLDFFKQVSTINSRIHYWMEQNCTW